MGRESRVKRARHVKVDDSLTFTTATELAEQARLRARATKAGLVLPVIHGPAFKIVRLNDE